MPTAVAPRPTELPAELLKRVEFQVLRRLDGFLYGDHGGPFHGPSLDLAEVREYQPGDDVRRIDWNATARTAQVHVRLFREEREVVGWLIVDTSASMDFGTRRRLKREQALEFAAVASAVMARQGRIGALLPAAEGLRMVPPGSGRRQSLRLVQELMAPPTPPGGAATRPDLAELLEAAGRRLRRRALVFVVSDFLDGRTGAGGPLAQGMAAAEAAPDWQRPLAQLARRHDVVAVRVVDPAERRLPAAGELRLRDPESGQEIWLDSDDPRVRQAYARLVEARDRAIARAFDTAQVRSLELPTDEDLIQPLLRFGGRRRGRR